MLVAVTLGLMQTRNNQAFEIVFKSKRMLNFARTFPHYLVYRFWNKGTITNVDYLDVPIPHVLEHCFSVPLLCFDVLSLIVFFLLLFCFPVCHPSCMPNTQTFYTLILLSSPLKPLQEYCWECVRTTINTRSPSRSACVSAPGMLTGVNSFEALLSETRRSTTGCWMLQRRQAILISRVCLCLIKHTHWGGMSGNDVW